MGQRNSPGTSGSIFSSAERISSKRGTKALTSARRIFFSRHASTIPYRVATSRWKGRHVSPSAPSFGSARLRSGAGSSSSRKASSASSSSVAKDSVGRSAARPVTVSRIVRPSAYESTLVVGAPPRKYSGALKMRADSSSLSLYDSNARATQPSRIFAPPERSSRMLDGRTWRWTTPRSCRKARPRTASQRASSRADAESGAARSRCPSEPPSMYA
mmetsp:Transcript_25945/g.86478  ORF Transcript_25945/g.86478 Transcript_25945/m.86478 type:complete len:216 (-) Transcript_25945:921-1568(-)